MDNPLIPNNSSEWFYDSYNSNAGLLIHIKNEIASTETKLQKVKILDTYEFGRILILNKYMYQAERGTELTEMLVHTPMNVGEKKKRILLIGGGDGVSLSQIVKYPFVETIDVVDIDEELTNFCKHNFFIDKKVFEDQRNNWYFQDGFEFLKKSNDKYDLILCVVSEIFNEDGTPGMAYKLYTEEFYKLVAEHLTSNGVFVSDGTTVHYTSAGYEWWKYLKKIQKYFKIAKPYVFNSKRMPGGDFVLLWGSQSIDPIVDLKPSKIKLDSDYYNAETHKASFILPERMKKQWMS